MTATGALVGPQPRPPPRPPAVAPGGWRVERVRGSADAFHARELPDDLVRTVWVLEVARPALVLGSSQRDEIVDRAGVDAAGVDVVRRRSGGGVVLLVPDEVLWVDVIIPPGDPLWDADVGRSAWWLGAAWARALADAGAAADPHVHRGALARTEWSSMACFAGVGPGEVLAGGPVLAGGAGSGGAVSGGAAKLVGISQRRTRAGARFQCALYRRHDPASLPALLALSGPSRRALTAVLAVGVATADLTVDALLAALPT